MKQYLELDYINGVAGGGVDRIIGSMFHKDAHAGPGGLYGPGGQLEHADEMAQIRAASEGWSLVGCALGSYNR